VLNVLILVAIILFFIPYEAMLRIRIAIHRNRAQDILQEYARKTVRRIFSIFRVYGDFSLEFDDRAAQVLPERFLLIANHQSLIDIPVLIYLLSSRRLRFVAKMELGRGIPLISLLLRAQGQALIKRRGDPAQAMKALARFSRRCRRDGTCPVVFPEGTRSRDGQVGEFYTAGVRRVLERESLPIVVAAVEGGWRIASLGSLVRNLQGTRYRVKILGILPPPQGKKAIQEAVQTARESIATEITVMRTESESAPALRVPRVRRAGRLPIE
jgi:1-acyl-sn-glycerol-3-phosphate acyltransferase